MVRPSRNLAGIFIGGRVRAITDQRVAFAPYQFVQKEASVQSLVKSQAHRLICELDGWNIRGAAQGDVRHRQTGLECELPGTVNPDEQRVPR